MKELKRVLCPVQLWDHLDDEVLEYAAATARSSSGEILFLYVYPGFAEYDGATKIMVISGDFSQAILQEAKEKMDQLLKNPVLDGVSCRAVYSEGVPVEQILEVAKKEKADIIVMGTHGRRGMDRFFFGSVAEKIVRMSPIPVMTIRPQG